MRNIRLRRGIFGAYAGPGSWGYGKIKCMRCPNDTSRDQPLCVPCQQKQQRHMMRKGKR